MYKNKIPIGRKICNGKIYCTTKLRFDIVTSIQCYRLCFLVHLLAVVAYPGPRSVCAVLPTHIATGVGHGGLRDGTNRSGTRLAVPSCLPVCTAAVDEFLEVVPELCVEDRVDDGVDGAVDVA